MRTAHFLSVAAFGVAAAFLTAPAANADNVKGSIGFDVNPARPGQAVTIIGECTAPGFTTAKLDSQGALQPVDAYLKDDGTGKMELWGVTEVQKNAKPGTYTVSYKCGDINVHTKFTVIGDKKPTPPPTPQVAVKPVGAVNGGGGGTADVADPAPVTIAPVNTAAAQSEGPGAGMYILGGTALLGAAGAGVLAFRRLRKET